MPLDGKRESGEKDLLTLIDGLFVAESTIVKRKGLPSLLRAVLYLIRGYVASAVVTPRFCWKVSTLQKTVTTRHQIQIIRSTGIVLAFADGKKSVIRSSKLPRQCPGTAGRRVRDVQGVPVRTALRVVGVMDG